MLNNTTKEDKMKKSHYIKTLKKLYKENQRDMEKAIKNKNYAFMSELRREAKELLGDIYREEIKKIDNN